MIDSALCLRTHGRGAWAGGNLRWFHAGFRQLFEFNPPSGDLRI